MKQKYYRLDKILSENALYNVIFGERSTGKTYAVLEYGLEHWIKKGEQLAIIRRFGDDFKQKRGSAMFDNHVNNGLITKLTKGEWTNVLFQSMRWFLCRYEDGKCIKQEEPFAYAFALSGSEHDKSTGYPKVTTILFDEFISRQGYFDEEFILFTNTLSTIIRLRTNVKIFMCGNTINRYNPYFTEMGLTHAKDMKAGSIDLYTYGESGLRVAVEFTGGEEKVKKESNIYFAFDNPKLNMITGEGNIWELSIYPHAPVKWLPKNVVRVFFIQFDDELLQCDIVQAERLLFIFVHRKTTPLKYPDKDLIYSTEYSAKPNYRRNINRPVTQGEKRICELIALQKVFFQDNEVGDTFFNYLNWCKQC